MGLREVVQNAASTAINATGNIAVEAVYISVEDVQTAFVPGTTPKVAQKISYKIKKAVRTGFSQRDVDGEVVRQEDFKLLIANADLPPAPSKRDFIEIDFIKYRVVNFKTDPAEAVFTFQMRLT